MAVKPGGPVSPLSFSSIPSQPDPARGRSAGAGEPRVRGALPAARSPALRLGNSAISRPPWGAAPRAVWGGPRRPQRVPGLCVLTDPPPHLLLFPPGGRTEPPTAQRGGGEHYINTRISFFGGGRKTVFLFPLPSLSPIKKKKKKAAQCVYTRTQGQTNPPDVPPPHPPRSLPAFISFGLGLGFYFIFLPPLVRGGLLFVACRQNIPIIRFQREEHPPYLNHKAIKARRLARSRVLFCSLLFSPA